MSYYNLAEIFAVPQIIMVLVIALLLFGPKRMPELGKSIGSALRELTKAKNDMMRSFSLDHEPDHHDSYRSDSNYSSDYNYNSSYNYNTTPDPPDLTDYTIAGVPPKETAAIDGTVARDSHTSNGHDPNSFADYTIAASVPPESVGAAAASESAVGGGHAATPQDGPHKGDNHV